MCQHQTSSDSRGGFCSSLLVANFGRSRKNVYSRESDLQGQPAWVSTPAQPSVIRGSSDHSESTSLCPRLLCELGIAIIIPTAPVRMNGKNKAHPTVSGTWSLLSECDAYHHGFWFSILGPKSLLDHWSLQCFGCVAVRVCGLGRDTLPLACV